MIVMTKLRNIFSITALMMLCGSMAMAQVTKGNLDQNADQSQGNYAATNLNYLGGYGSLGMMQSAWKDPMQHMGEGQTRPGYSKYYWTPDLVLPVRVREGMYTLINFPKWEMIENVYIGDGLSFTAQIQGPSSLMVYPDSSQFVGVDTNMIVFGRSGNKYVFYLQSETVNTDRITNAIIDIEVVNKNKNGQALGYQGGGYSAAGGGNVANGPDNVNGTYTRDLQKEDWIEKIPVDPTQFRFDIEVYVPNPDDIIIAPERVWRDNIFTYIDLGEKALTAVQRPIVTLIVERSETPVGFRSAGPNNRLIIVEGMGDMVLRSGKRLVCLKLRRSDADGLENAIYAKSNEWDLQNAHASSPDVDFEEDEDIEDVYGTSEAMDGMNGNKKENSFFDFSSFLSGSKKSEPVSNLDVLSSGIVAGAAGNTASEIVETTINSMPKVKPIVAEKEVIAKPVSKELLGQYDVKYNNQEVIVPEYSNQKQVVNVDIKNLGTSLGDKDVIKDTKVGVKDANPVLISYSDDKNITLAGEETDSLIKEFTQTKRFDNKKDSSISIELGTDENVNNLEKLWSELAKRYSATIGKYNPYYSVDAPADGQGKEVFHLRVGPIDTLEEGDRVCSQLGRNGIFCSVVRIQ